jgi:hypothetical protein
MAASWARRVTKERIINKKAKAIRFLFILISFLAET